MVMVMGIHILFLNKKEKERKEKANKYIIKLKPVCDLSYEKKSSQ